MKQIKKKIEQNDKMLKRSFPSNHKEDDQDQIKVKSPRRRHQINVKRVCIKVPSTKDKLERSLYESFNVATRREQWIDHVLGKDGIYAGRPQNDGGWYQVPKIKQGSFLANPFHCKDYGLNKSLELYENYLRTRLSNSCTSEKLISLLPGKNQKAASQYYSSSNKANQHQSAREDSTKAIFGKSMKHFELDVRGDEFKRRLMNLNGKKLGCFCDLSQPCHVDVLIKVIHELLTT